MSAIYLDDVSSLSQDDIEYAEGSALEPSIPLLDISEFTSSEDYEEQLMADWLSQWGENGCMAQYFDDSILSDYAPPPTKRLPEY